MRFASAGSDLLTDLEAFETCERLHSEGKGRSAIKSFCEEVSINTYGIKTSRIKISSKNFISFTSLQDIISLRGDFLSSLSDIGFIPISTTHRSKSMNKNSENINLVKSIVVGGLWPRITRVHLPKSAIKFDKIQAGTIQRENEAKDFRLYDLQGGRVFLHPGSVLFDVNVWKSPFLVYFSKFQTAKVFLRDATVVCAFFHGLIDDVYVFFCWLDSDVCTVIVWWPCFHKSCGRRISCRHKR
jgi:ATP-dependent RNA helicase DHX57